MNWRASIDLFPPTVVLALTGIALWGQVLGQLLMRGLH